MKVFNTRIWTRAALLALPVLAKPIRTISINEYTIKWVNGGTAKFSDVEDAVRYACCEKHHIAGRQVGKTYTTWKELEGQIASDWLKP